MHGPLYDSAMQLSCELGPRTCDAAVLFGLWRTSIRYNYTVITVFLPALLTRIYYSNGADAYLLSFSITCRSVSKINCWLLVLQWVNDSLLFAVDACRHNNSSAIVKIIKYFLSVWFSLMNAVFWQVCRQVYRLLTCCSDINQMSAVVKRKSRILIVLNSTKLTNLFEEKRLVWNVINVDKSNFLRNNSVYTSSSNTEFNKPFYNARQTFISYALSQYQSA